MEEYFGQKCVTADASPAPLDAVSTWSTTHRCECVMVHENAQAHGASRAVLASIVEMITTSRKTHRVVLIMLEPSFVDLRVTEQEKLVSIDLSAHCLSHLSDDTVDSPLLTMIQDKLGTSLGSSTLASDAARPNVVVLDSLNVLLELFPVARILTWLRTLRRDLRIGSIIFRVNASALMTMSPSAVVQTLAHETTAVVQVETPSSLRAYPILAKERRREIPPRMHGMVLLLRKKKNGRTSESVEYFYVANGRMVYRSDGDAFMTVSKTSTNDVQREQTTESAKPSASTTTRNQALPIGADEVSFNLSISAEEEVAKRNVELPYMHQGTAVNNLLFIDEDDPEWDDDDLDDDLDI